MKVAAPFHFTWTSFTTCYASLLSFVALQFNLLLTVHFVQLCHSLHPRFIIPPVNFLHLTLSVEPVSLFTSTTIFRAVFGTLFSTVKGYLIYSVCLRLFNRSTSSRDLFSNCQRTSRNSEINGWYPAVDPWESRIHQSGPCYIHVFQMRTTISSLSICSIEPSLFLLVFLTD